MWLKLANAIFTTNLGTMSQLSNSYIVSYSLSGDITKDSCPSSIAKASGQNYAGSNLVATFTLSNAAELVSGGTNITVNGVALTASTHYTITTSSNTVTLTIFAANITGNVHISIAATGATPTPVINNYTFTINPTPSDATVTINGSTRTSLTTTAGTTITWSVEKTGYTSQSGSYTLNDNHTENITLIATSGGGNGALDLSNLSLAHCGSSKLAADGNKENLSYNQTTHALTVNSTGWYKVSYFTTPVQVGTEIEFLTNYSTTMNGNFFGLYLQDELIDGVSEVAGSFWPSATSFGIYASGSASQNEPLVLWSNKKSNIANSLATDCNGKTVKLQMFADGVKVFIDGTELTLPRACPLTTDTNYYLGFHNSCNNSATVAETINYIGPIR